MADMIILHDVVGSFLNGRDSLTSDDLADLWWSVFNRGTAGADEGLVRFVDLLSVDTEIDGLEFKLGAWKWDVQANVANSVLSSLLIGGVFEATGHLHWAGYTLPAVLGVLFKMEKVRIETKDKALALVLQQQTGDDGRPRTVDELFNLLPQREKRLIAKSDFVAFVERLRQSGKAEQEIGGTFRIVPDGKEPWIKIIVM
ncbi:hypothetical protein [Nocardia vaccinii]|uniref:hypothetical protein n=1 Tax=Nocardia vaccinii TaxID=1822 RepID=UPI000AA39456|nr:hypothetical protein [Nocardia vaccinii]